MNKELKDLILTRQATLDAKYDFTNNQSTLDFVNSFSSDIKTLAKDETPEDVFKFMYVIVKDVTEAKADKVLESIKRFVADYSVSGADFLAGFLDKLVDVFKKNGHMSCKELINYDKDDDMTQYIRTFFQDYLKEGCTPEGIDNILDIIYDEESRNIFLYCSHIQRVKELLKETDENKKKTIYDGDSREFKRFVNRTFKMVKHINKKVLIIF